MRESEGLEFQILLDPRAETIQAWGLLNEASDRAIPHPTVVIVDRDGVVRYVRVDTDYRVRPPSSELVERLRDLNPTE
jgi:peroxiredoxin